MRTHFTLLRGALALLLVVSGCLFAVGSTIERNHRHHESAPAKSTETTTTSSETGGETGSEGSAAKPAEQTHAEAATRILGVNTESTALSVVAVIASLLLAAAVSLRPARVVLAAVGAFGLVFAAGDGRELVHQIDDSNSGLAAVAALLLLLHLLVAALAAAGLRQRRVQPSARPAEPII